MCLPRRHHSLSRRRSPLHLRRRSLRRHLAAAAAAVPLPSSSPPPACTTCARYAPGVCRSCGSRVLSRAAVRPALRRRYELRRHHRLSPHRAEPSHARSLLHASPRRRAAPYRLVRRCRAPASNAVLVGAELARGETRLALPTRAYSRAARISRASPPYLRPLRHHRSSALRRRPSSHATTPIAVTLTPLRMGSPMGRRHRHHTPSPLRLRGKPRHRHQHRSPLHRHLPPTHRRYRHVASPPSPLSRPPRHHLRQHRSIARPTGLAVRILARRSPHRSTRSTSTPRVRTSSPSSPRRIAAPLVRVSACYVSLIDGRSPASSSHACVPMGTFGELARCVYIYARAASP